MFEAADSCRRRMYAASRDECVPKIIRIGPSRRMPRSPMAPRTADQMESQESAHELKILASGSSPHGS